MRIRPYRPGDLSAVLALQTNSDADLAATVPENFYDDLRSIETAYAKGAFVIAESEDLIVGMGGLLPTGEIVRMRVDIQHRRKGIASQVLDALLLRARELGLSRVFLHTLNEQLAAQQLYQAKGFLELGRGEIHGNSVIAYELDLRGDGA
jgi:ribosomal-protein-alanine N-acetyltransferase